MRRAARRDGNEKLIRDALHGAGFLTEPVSAPGLPDLIVWKPGTCWLRLAENKAAGGSITPKQAEFRERYSGPPILVFTGPADAVRQARDAMAGHNRSAWEDAHKPSGPPPRFPDGQRDE